MPDDQGDIGQAQNGQSTSNSKQNQHTPPHSQDSSVRQKGDRPVNIGDFSGGRFQQGDQYNYGLSIEEIRAIVQEFYRLQTAQTQSRIGRNHSTDVNDSPIIRINIDSSTLENINTKLDLIEEIADAGGFTNAHQEELNQLKQQLQEFQTLNQELLQLEKQGERLIQSVVADLEQQLADLKLRGEDLTDTVRAELSPKELECRESENKVLEHFIGRSEASRHGAVWVTQNLDFLKKYSCHQTLRQFPNLQLSTQTIDDFQFSLQQFLEQISFCLHWGTYKIFDSPDIPFVLEAEHYQVAFSSIKNCIPPRFGDETIHAIEACIDYLNERLPALYYK